MRFSNAAERDAAVVQMNGMQLGGRNIRCSVAQPKLKPDGPSPMAMMAAGMPPAPMPLPPPSYGGAQALKDGGGDENPHNTSLFIGTLLAAPPARAIVLYRILQQAQSPTQSHGRRRWQT